MYAVLGTIALLEEDWQGYLDWLANTSAGKSDNDIQFDEFYPSGYDYPKLLTVGAVDLAGKLLALYPDLSVAQLKAAIIEGADEKALETRSIRLMNPRSSLELAASLP